MVAVMHRAPLWVAVATICLRLAAPVGCNERQAITETTNDTLEATAAIAIDRGFCGNHFNESDESQHKCMLYNGTVRCYGRAVDLQHIKAQRAHDVRQIILCNWQNETFDPMILMKFTKLKAFHMEYGLMKYMASDFPQLYHLQAINISFTPIANIKPTAFRQLAALKSIDLRYNQFNYVDKSFVLHPNPTRRHPHIYLSENPWNCTKNYKWLNNHVKTRHIIDREAMECNDLRFQKHSVLRVMHFRRAIHNLCFANLELRNCSCSLSFITLDLEEVWRPMYSINCSNLNLYELPSAMPENTTIFYAQNNHISNIDVIITTAYSSVLDIYLDYNEISSIEVLESDGWLDRFRAFSLRGNDLNKMPVYLLSNALEHNHQASALYLSENPWRCECVFAFRFQELLQRHRELIKDVNDIRCEHVTDDGNILHNSVLALKRTDICKIDVPAIPLIDWLNIGMAVLIVFIVSKLSYDYYYYRKSGRLPWIVTKMP